MRFRQKNFGRRTTIVSAAVAAMLLALPHAGAGAAPHDDQELRNLAVVQQGMDAWRDGTGSPYDALAPDATWEITGNSVASRLYTSKDDFITAVIVPFNARLSSRLVPTVRHLYSDGDTVIALFDAEGVARDGIPYRNTYSWFLRLRDEQIVAATAFFDSVAFNDFWQRVTPA